MQTDAPLNRRAQEILHSVVKEYIETGEPVGSRTVSKRRSEELSAASIRNVMADLADEGYLSQPHTSAGRVPTEKAFQNYVRYISAGRMPAAETERLRAELNGLATFDERMERSSHILMEMTRNVGIAASMPMQQALEQVELLPLADRRVLMILVTRDGAVRNRVVSMQEAISSDELGSLRNYVNRNFGGWLLDDARRELLRRMAEERAAYDATLRKLAVLYRMGLLEPEPVPEIHMEGASNLVGIDLHLTAEKMRELLRALEEKKKRLVELLDRFLETPPGELAVKVGLEDASPVMKELVLIGLTLHTPSGFGARVAVLGPMRMQYERVMAAVLLIGRAFETM